MKELDLPQGCDTHAEIESLLRQFVPEFAYVTSAHCLDVEGSIAPVLINYITSDGREAWAGNPRPADILVTFCSDLDLTQPQQSPARGSQYPRHEAIHPQKL